MTDMFQIVSHWTGFVGAPGYTNMFFEHSDPPSTGAQTAADNVRAFWFSIRTELPDDVTITVDPVVKIINAETGDLTSIITVGTAPAAVTGFSTAIYAAPVGLGINWTTSTVHAARRIRGRTFVVPVTSGEFTTTGQPTSTALSNTQAAATTLRTATGPTFGIWSRPITDGPSRVPPVANRAGGFGPATANSVSNKGVVLRSRRD